MALARFTDTITGVDERGVPGVEVRARFVDYQPGTTRGNEWKVARTNQAGVFTMDLEQGQVVRIVITDLGLDAEITVPASATFDLSAFTS